MSVVDAKKKALNAKKAVLKGLHSHKKKKMKNVCCGCQKEGFKCQEGSIEGTSFPQEEEDAQVCPLPPSQNTQASKGTKISPQISCKALQVGFLCHRKKPIDNGRKKAYVKLASDYDALDVANKIGII